MYSIKEEDVRNIAAELTGSESFVVSPLYEVMRKTSFPAICAKCRSTACLRDRAVEEDIFQDVYIRVWTHAFRILFTDEGLNADPVVFARWLATVTKNRISDYIRRASGQDARTEVRRRGADGQDEDPFLRVAAPDFSEERDRARGLLLEAVDRVMGKGSSLHIDLAWLAYMLLVLTEGAERGKASGLVALRYGDLTLREMYQAVVCDAHTVSWMRISSAALEQMQSRLLEKDEKGVVYGRAVFSSFFMKKGGAASVSDWVNRVNGRIRKILEALPKEDR